MTYYGTVHKLTFILLLILLSACRLDYRSDIGFLNSAQANAFEFPVEVNRKWCRDLDGKPGLCVFQVKYDEPILIAVPRRDYGYSVAFTCTSELDFSKTYTIPAGHFFKIEIQDYKGLKFFHCIGEVFPDDRENRVSAKFGFYVKVIDPEYVPREVMFKHKKKLILGARAKYSRVCFESGKCRTFKKKTVYSPRWGNLKFAFSESELMRFNYWGMDGR